MMMLSFIEFVGPLAQALPTEGGDPFRWMMLLRALVAAVAFSILGVLVLGISTWTLAHLLPFSMRKEIEEDQNTALGIIIGSLILGMSLIIAASILG
jgi:putative membrane protein